MGDGSSEVVAYYEGKTASILRKYGPGPRVHFHTGLFEGAVDPHWSLAELRAQMVASQTRLLERCAESWGAFEWEGRRVLDLGCGLGGGAIFWSERFGARVTAVTNVEAHRAIVERFAREAGVGERVDVLVEDAVALERAGATEIAVAVESSCYFDRARWFMRLAQLLPPGGSVHVIDCFLGRPELAAPFDAYWRTRIGTLEEYCAAARAAGFEEGQVVALGKEAAGFWPLSLAWSHRALETSPEPVEARRLTVSLEAHRQLHGAFLDGGIAYLMASFQRR